MRSERIAAIGGMSDQESVPTVEYLTAAEAAEYACMPLADFEALALRYGIRSFHLFRKADVTTAMGRAAAMGRRPA
jgi:hypothetical protein